MTIDERPHQRPLRTRRVVAVLLVLVVIVLILEADQRARFAANFELHTGIRWPGPGYILPPLFWLGAMTGETKVFVSTSREENERIDLEIRQREERPREHRGGSCRIASDAHSYEIVVFASEMGSIQVSRTTGR